MYLHLILFVLFFFFTHKQVYASVHFTGSSKTMPSILTFLSLFNILAGIAFAIHYSITVSFWFVLLFTVLAIIATLIANRIISKFVLKHLVKEGYDMTDNLILYTYNAECDIVSTVLAEIGILANIAIAVFYILSAL